MSKIKKAVKKAVQKTGMKIREKIPSIPPVFDKAWVARQLKEIEKIQKIIISDQKDLDDFFEEIHRETVLMLDKINELEEALLPSGSTTKPVSPALEKAVNTVYEQSVKIDKQVPDKNVPPGIGPAPSDNTE